MRDTIHQSAVEMLALIRDTDADWLRLSELWLDLSLASKGSFWESAVDFLGESLRARDIDAATGGLKALARNSLRPPVST